MTFHDDRVLFCKPYILCNCSSCLFMITSNHYCFDSSLSTLFYRFRYFFSWRVNQTIKADKGHFFFQVVSIFTICFFLCFYSYSICSIFFSFYIVCLFYYFICFL